MIDMLLSNAGHWSSRVHPLNWPCTSALGMDTKGLFDARQNDQLFEVLQPILLLKASQSH